MSRFVVIIWIGGIVNRNQTGVTRSILMRRVVRAGLVVADVAVLCVERKSVSWRRGSKSTLHLEVKTLRVSTISSNVFWCFVLVISESAFLCFFVCFSTVKPVDESGEYRLEYIPNIKPMTTTTGPAHLNNMSPYRMIPQNPATSKKLSHGSPLVHVSNPANLFRGRRNGCEYAKALVICGGVAMSNGDFWWTRIVERCLLVDVA